MYYTKFVEFLKSHNLYDEEIILTSSLTIPHPHMKERRFVLEPMAQIAPQLIIPNETKTIAELLADIC